MPGSANASSSSLTQSASLSTHTCWTSIHKVLTEHTASAMAGGGMGLQESS